MIDLVIEINGGDKWLVVENRERIVGKELWELFLWEADS